MRFALTSFATLAAATLALAQPARRADTLSFNPTDAQIAAAPGLSPRAAAPAPLTNAKRFALGLPPLAPEAVRRRPHRGGPHGGTPVRAAARAAASPLPPVSQKCNIMATGMDGTNFGYISPVWNGFGEYGAFQASPVGALEVSFSYVPDSASQLDFTATNSPSATYPFFGAISGFASTSDDMGPDTFNYAYLGGTTQTPFGTPFTGDSSFSAATSIPENIESAVWSYDAATQAITAQWINTDGSAPVTHIVYANDDNQALALTGDVAAFQAAFVAPYPELTFKCVPPTASTPV